ncbi:DUF4192 domain-containing protein [Rhodococcus spongiicola]|uniref:DUF4192 domain-containing protein n=1 Tax=Rhodococcus spongiicola TaxID=2487352 RepID=A0A3S3E1Z0_9NOCA|nr:DUF4192 domain-containing protein [Rhodococcus spongiicola]RVW03519.1 DUF4192 domain-containing protein [Rhodococcus spongiicola]
MTTSASRHDSHLPQGSDTISPSSAGTDVLCAVRISDPGTLISAVPALLGFHPRRSLVAICLAGTSVGAVMRHDLLLTTVGPDAEVMELVLDQFAAVAAREGADQMVVVMVDDRIPSRPQAADLNRYAGIADKFREVLRRGGTELVAVHACSSIQTGAPWRDLFGAGRGVLPDPTASEVAAAQVLGGRPIRGSREELEAVLDPVSPHDQVRVADVIDAAREERARDAALARAATDDVGTHRRSLERVLSQIAQLESGDEPTTAECAELALMLETPSVRDSLLALSASEQADAAEQMWIHLGRTLPDPERAEPLALLGYSAYIRGDGPMAGVALCAALSADPGHRMAKLLDDALQAGVRPDALRDLAIVGHQVARDLGVQLPSVESLPPRGV